MTPEAKVKKKVVTLLKKRGVYYFYPVMGGFGRSGIPDIVCCFKGHFIGIECKAGSNKPTALQELEMQKIRDVGGTTLVVNEENLNDVEEVINLIESNYGNSNDARPSD